MVGLATALTGQFRRHGGSLKLAVGVGLVVGLLAVGLAVGNLAARHNTFIWLIWAQTLLPMVVSAWFMTGLPLLPRATAARFGS